ncbi:UDP-glucose 4-epimerase GalE [Bosea sp. BH3]|uniref:UDP-glucose 4-epimerase GalE n=1 Tax=Bosea sp. BH3 TaxID=2871701 RepID=UPI0021CB236E|nr:UDP-glucose 4-epimerase GalE [Bosea sp. BH3]MCU4181247.1 UDP-glucose 4-epimerase GalE [Bosea sp. BH3]
MSILVTGGAGYIGSHMVLELLARGETVVVIDNLSTGNRAAVPAGVPLIVGDIGDFETVAGVLREHAVRSVIHFAARIVVPESMVDPLGYYLANTVKMRTLLAACVAGQVGEFIFSSTAAVYGETTLEPVRETDPTNPLSPYGTSKLVSEWMLRDTAVAHGLRYAILRYFNVAGADPAGRTGQSNPAATHLIKVALQAALGTRPYVEVFGQDYPTADGTGVRDYIHVSDLASAHAAVLDSLRAGSRNLLVNAGYGRGYSVREVIRSVENIAGCKVEVRQAPRRPGDAPSVIAEASQLRRDIGWIPRYENLDTIIRHAYDWESLTTS